MLYLLRPQMLLLSGPWCSRGLSLQSPQRNRLQLLPSRPCNGTQLLLPRAPWCHLLWRLPVCPACGQRIFLSRTTSGWRQHCSAARAARTICCGKTCGSGIIPHHLPPASFRFLPGTSPMTFLCGCPTSCGRCRSPAPSQVVCRGSEEQGCTRGHGRCWTLIGSTSLWGRTSAAKCARPPMCPGARLYCSSWIWPTDLSSGSS